MAKAPPSSRSQMTKDSTKSSSKSDSGGVSRHATRPTTTGPGTGSQPTSRVVKSRSTQISSPVTAISTRVQDKKDIRQACDEILKTAEDEIQRKNKEIKRLNEEKDKQTRHYTRVVHRLNADKAHEADQLRESTAKLERAITTSQKLENEVSQLKQQLDDVRINTREVVAWVEVQPILDRIRGFISTGNTTWNEIQALENRHMTKQLPGDGVIPEPWSNPSVQFGMLDPNSLSSFPVQNNFALNAQQVPPLPGQYASLS